MKKNKLLTKNKKQQANLELDITSLLDILSIILVFLLFSYNPSDLKLDLVSNLQLAESLTKKNTTLAPVIQLNKELKLFFNSVEIGSIEDEENLEKIKDLLRKEKETDESKSVVAGKTQSEPIVNLVFDKSMASKYVNKLMNASAEAGFSKFKFIVGPK